jgi:RNA polymerase sigma-70 factor (ECF subfamily)
MKTDQLLLNRAYLDASVIDWRSVYDELLPRLFHYFCYRTGDAHTAEELTALTLETAWEKRSRYQRQVGAFNDWVFGIARITAAQYFRSCRPVLPLEEAAETPAPEMVEQLAERQLAFDRLYDLLRQFPDRERELVALKFGAELTNRQIARLRGLSESNVGTILSRVISKLRKLWEENDER